MIFPIFKSIRGKIILMTVVCWFVPMAVIVIVSAVNLKKGVEKTSGEYLRAKISYGTQISGERLDAMVNLSRRASYDREIENSVELYEKGSISETALIIKVNKYIAMNYNAPEILFAAISLECTPHSIYGNSSVSKKYAELEEYARTRHMEIMRFADTLDTYIGFYTDNENGLYLVRNILIFDDYLSSRVKVGTIVFKLDSGYIFNDLLQNSKLEHDLTVVINNAVLQLTAGDEYITTESIIENMDKTVIENDKTYIFSKIKTRDYECLYSVGTDNKILYAEYRNMRDTVIAIVVVVIPLLTAFTIMFYRSIALPIRNLVKAIQNIEHGNLGIQVQKSDSGEFGYLFNAFNSMSKELSNLFERLYMEQLNAKDAKIMALQSQINPHFLSNTLELMNWQLRMRNNETISSMIEALSTMMDSSMNRPNKRMIPLFEELKHADAYLYIISMRFEDRLQIIKNIDDELLCVNVPSLIIQPLLENAVKYGIDPAYGGIIELQVYKEADLIIKIKNTGMKLKDGDKLKIETLLNGNDPSLTNLGIRNVQMRLKLIYGEASGLSIYESDGKTIAQINIFL